MSVQRNTVLLVLSLAVTSCAGSPHGAAPAEHVVIKLERDACLGPCPVYEVTIHGDGSVVYLGRYNVRVTGEQHGMARREDVARLQAMFERAHFFELKDRYFADVTCNPTYVVTYELNGRSKTVEDYVGLDVGMPPVMRTIEDEIDRVAQTKQWVSDTR